MCVPPRRFLAPRPPGARCGGCGIAPTCVKQQIITHLKLIQFTIIGIYMIQTVITYNHFCNDTLWILKTSVYHNRQKSSGGMRRVRYRADLGGRRNWSGSFLCQYFASSLVSSKDWDWPHRAFIWRRHRGTQTRHVPQRGADIGWYTFDQWNRNPRPQLEPQITSSDKCNITVSFQNFMFVFAG